MLFIMGFILKKSMDPGLQYRNKTHLTKQIKTWVKVVQPGEKAHCTKRIFHGHRKKLKYMSIQIKIRSFLIFSSAETVKMASKKVLYCTAKK